LDGNYFTYAVLIIFCINVRIQMPGKLNIVSEEQDCLQ